MGNAVAMSRVNVTSDAKIAVWMVTTTRAASDSRGNTVAGTSAPRISKNTAISRYTRAAQPP